MTPEEYDRRKNFALLRAAFNATHISLEERIEIACAVARDIDRLSAAEEREACAALAENSDVVRAAGEFADLSPKKGDGWHEEWPHVGFRIAAAIRRRGQ